MNACCGTSRDSNSDGKPIMQQSTPGGSNYVNNGTYGVHTQQPSASSAPSTQFNPPNLTQPLPTHQVNNSYSESYGTPGSLPPWGASASPPDTPSAYQTTLTPNRMSSFNGNGGLNYTQGSIHGSQQGSEFGYGGMPPIRSPGLDGTQSVYGQSTLDHALPPPPSIITATRGRRDFDTPHALQAVDDGKISIAIDFGTTFSGVAYGSSRIAGGAVQQILQWPGTSDTFRKIPTCLLYDEQGRVIAWGLEAKNRGPMVGTWKCEWFKLFLEPQALRDHSSIDPRLPPLPPGKQALDLIIDFLTCLWEYAKDQITREIGAVADLDSAEVWLTVPAAWDAKGCDMMREAAIAAQLVHASRPGDKEWRERLKIITEPEAAAIHCAHLTELHRLRPTQSFMIVDAGGGTVDLAVYRILGDPQHLEIGELCARSGANCGSIFLDLRFRKLIEEILRDHPSHLDPASLANFMHAFQQVDKLEYKGVVDDETRFRFTCFNPEDAHDPSVGLVNGELVIQGKHLRREVFDPVVDEVLHLIEDQAKKLDRPVDGLLLVGGFSQCEYLMNRVQEIFASRIRVIARPSDADTATLRGAARFGLARRSLVSTMIAPRSYIMKVKLPAEPQDSQLRPAYISYNAAGAPVCENRLQYLVVKGAILRKGQRITTKLCKFSTSAHDSFFTAVLYVADTERVFRYTDEGDISELCKWQVDLRSLPSFQQNAAVPTSEGFYTEFELGLELDSAEVRGILIWQGQEWGRVVFDFRN